MVDLNPEVPWESLHVARCKEAPLGAISDMASLAPMEKGSGECFMDSQDTLLSARESVEGKYKSPG